MLARPIEVILSDKWYYLYGYISVPTVAKDEMAINAFILVTGAQQR